MAKTALVLGLPSKGRLQEQVVACLGRAGLSLVRNGGVRGYSAHLQGIDGVEVKLLSAVDIASALALGELHLGITGEDLLHESGACPGRVDLLAPLGFGLADVVVAVPMAWIDVSTMADLDDVAGVFHVRHHFRLRVATKYPTLTRGFFAAHGVGAYRIVESLGATEGAPAAGAAEAIVDITTTKGATLAANGLKVLEDGLILKSQAHLAAAQDVSWNRTQRELTSALAMRLEDSRP